ncbi:hypothetical protein MMC18_007763 [Xylographa bjoerkii]|nr:hypothetical protein [Xylographa bjoerkii]
MPHPIQSHKSEEGLMRKFFSVDIAKVATRTSSVRLKWRQRPADFVSKPSSIQLGCYLIPNVRDSDLGTEEARILHPRKPSHLRIRKPRASALSSLGQDSIEDPVVQTRLGHYDGRKNSQYENGTGCNQKGINPTTTADRTHGSMKLEKEDIPCMASKGTSTERPLTHYGKGGTQETPCRSSNIAWTTTNNQRGERVKSAEELRIEEWKLVRAAMQVEMDVLEDASPTVPTLHDSHRPWRAWKHASHNFFPPGFQRVDQEEVVRTVLEGGRMRVRDSHD